MSAPPTVAERSEKQQESVLRPNWHFQDVLSYAERFGSIPPDIHWLIAAQAQAWLQEDRVYEPASDTVREGPHHRFHSVVSKGIKHHLLAGASRASLDGIPLASETALLRTDEYVYEPCPECGHLALLLYVVVPEGGVVSSRPVVLYELAGHAGVEVTGNLRAGDLLE